VIPIGTRLTPRDPQDPVVEVGGIEGSRYTLHPTAEFGPVFALTPDQLSAAYDTAGHSLEILPFSEIEAWWAMANAKPRRAARVKQEPQRSPEEIFADARPAK
jgi:hypothetical protein